MRAALLAALLGGAPTPTRGPAKLLQPAASLFATDPAALRTEMAAGRPIEGVRACELEGAPWEARYGYVLEVVTTGVRSAPSPSEALSAFGLHRDKHASAGRVAPKERELIPGGQNRRAWRVTVTGIRAAQVHHRDGADEEQGAHAAAGRRHLRLAGGSRKRW